MSAYGVFFIAIALSVLSFISIDLKAADIQKQADSKPDAKIADKVRMDKSASANLGKGGTDAFGDKGGLFRKFISELSPEDLERLKKLNKENPEAFREEIRKKLESKRSESEGQNKQASELAEKFRKADADKEKVKIKNELRDSVKDEFEKKMEINRKRLEQAEKQLSEFKVKLDERKKKADEIIDGRVNDLLKDPGMKW